MCFTTQARPIIANIETKKSINLCIIIHPKLLLYFIVYEDTLKSRKDIFVRLSILHEWKLIRACMLALGLPWNGKTDQEIANNTRL
jgi:hypothetical protein